jgi:hypothetical protein
LVAGATITGSFLAVAFAIFGLSKIGPPEPKNTDPHATSVDVVPSASSTANLKPIQLRLRDSSFADNTESFGGLANYFYKPHLNLWFADVNIETSSTLMLKPASELATPADSKPQPRRDSAKFLKPPRHHK